MRVIDSIEEPFDILIASHDAWETEKLHRWVIRMDAHVHAPLIACRHDGSKEVAHVLTECIAVDILIECEKRAELAYWVEVFLRDVAIDKALSLDDDVLDHTVVVLLGHVLRHLISLCILFIGIILLCTFALEDVTLEIAELHLIEIERSATVSPRVVEIGTRPVEHRHEVIADGLHASLAEVSETDLVFLDEFVTVRTTILD